MLSKRFKANTFKIWFLFFFLVSIPLSNAIGEDYLKEFNNVGEQCSIHSGWRYLDNELVERFIVNYRCCKDNDCLDLPYDIENNYILNIDQIIDISKLIILKSNIENNYIKESDYDLEKKDDSIICHYYGLGVLEEESKNLGAEIAVEKAVPELLSKKAANIVSNMYGLSKRLNLIKDVNLGALILSVSCEGGKLIEYVALSSLTSCKSYIFNEKNQYAYYGMADDLVNCHTESLNKLDAAKYSPNTLFQHAEQRLVDSLKCFLNTGKQCQTYSETEYDYYTKKIKQLRTNLPNLNFDSIAGDNAKMANNRFKEKKDVVNEKLTLFSQKINEIEANISSKKKDIFNIFFFPNYDFSNVDTKINLFKNELQKAKELIDSNKFNSASEAIKANEEALNIIDNDLHNEFNKERKISWWVWGLVMVVAIIFFRWLFQ